MSIRCALGIHKWKPCMKWFEPPKLGPEDDASALALFMPGLITAFLLGQWKPHWIKDGHKCDRCGKKKP